MRNIHEIDRNITELRKEYAQLVELAKISALTEEERLSYYRAQHQIACMIDSYETAKKNGLKEGMEKGRKEEQLEIARAMKKQQLDTEIIAACTKLTIEEISQL